MQNNQPLKINAETKLEQQKILYLQSDVNYTYVHTYDKVFLSSRTLKILSARINSASFIKIHRGLLVNTLYIANLNDDKHDPFIELISGERLKISRRMFLGVRREIGKVVLIDYDKKKT
jgi:two-component system, LytTR family, response regulator